jgi:hypothetical protein
VQNLVKLRNVRIAIIAIAPVMPNVISTARSIEDERALLFDGLVYSSVHNDSVMAVTQVGQLPFAYRVPLLRRFLSDFGNLAYVY